MHIIPVIDLMHGQVVQAIQGQRQHYRPIQSKLTPSHTLPDVVAAILQVYPFDCVYIADLNAITKNTQQANHLSLIHQTMREFPQLTWWVDAGIQRLDALHKWQSIGIVPILASESLTEYETYQQLKEAAKNSILSLDFFQDGYHGSPQLLATPAQWTQPTLVMSLPKVGTNQGPDLENIRQLKQQTSQPSLYAAGGVRHQQDIEALEKEGVQGVLVASALHQKKLTLTC